jgi:hypothetical protein
VHNNISFTVHTSIITLEVDVFRLEFEVIFFHVLALIIVVCDATSNVTKHIGWTADQQKHTSLDE